ncbi:unnamed protein product [Pseudo-nitzschia multistriata]|uniref:PsbP C-terminal domain-containing protein n=1 Tax=Pseudo-nitzschia multistriata TaxID=183589 RepID=A0A448ZBR8_9STRA|nr:unnamed protein product [Pseudo-nitzschia multistriata]
MTQFLRNYLALALVAIASLTAVRGFSVSNGETRRGFASSVAGIVTGSSALLIDPSRVFAEDAAATPLARYENSNCKFSIDLPSEWTMTEQSLPDRRKIILYIKPDSNQKTLFFIAFTPTRDDFTSLGSFGSVDEVGQATILPKAELAAKQGIESEMLSAVSKKQAYFFDYVQSVPSQPKTHFRTIFSLATGATGGAGNVLVTITAQTPESDYAAMEPLFNKVLDSYKNA